jgi:hypothetical protein
MHSQLLTEPVSAQRTGERLQRFDTGAHDLPAPEIQEHARPGGGVVFPEGAAISAKSGLSRVRERRFEPCSSRRASAESWRST